MDKGRALDEANAGGHVTTLPLIAIASMSFSELAVVQREALTGQITQLLRQLNAWTHPARLPPELLCEIFADIYPNQPGKRTSHGVFTVAQVCHRWREVALASHQLWTHIELDRNEDYIRMMFERSQECLLDFTYSEHHAGNPKYHLVWSQMDRARSVVFSCSPDNAHLPSEKLHAPNLETFIEKFGFTTDSPLLPLLDAPRLRRAVVLAPSVPAAHSLTSLTQLEVLWVEGQPFNPPLEHVLSTLGSLSSLTSLRIAIQFDLRAETPRIPQDCPIVPLDKLETLEFGEGCDVAGAAFFLKHTHVPLHTRIISKADVGNANFNVPEVKLLMYGSTMTVLQQFCATHTLTGLRLELRESSSHHKGLSLNVSATTEEPKDGLRPMSRQQEMPFAITLPYRPEAYPSLTPLISDLRSLTISAHWKPSDLAGLHSMLGTLARVESVTLYNERARLDRKSQLRFLEADEFFAAPGGGLHFPRLQTLRLANLELDGDFCMHCVGISLNDWGFSGKCACAMHYPRLVNWLARRCAAGMPLSRIVFECCSDLKEKRTMELQSLVTGEVVEIENATSRRERRV